MPWRRFCGWEPRQVTTHTYEAGVLVASVTTAEPEWGDEDRSWAEALHLVESQECGNCKESLVDSTDPAREGRYVAEQPIRCHKCTAIGQQAEAYRDNGQPHALLYPVRYQVPHRAGGESM